MLLGVVATHVQTLTRFIVFNPAVHWIAADVASISARHRTAVLVYHAGYAALGTVFFAAFLPWT